MTFVLQHNNPIVSVLDQPLGTKFPTLSCRNLKYVKILKHFVSKFLNSNLTFHHHYQCLTKVDPSSLFRLLNFHLKYWCQLKLGKKRNAVSFSSLYHKLQGVTFLGFTISETCFPNATWRISVISKLRFWLLLPQSMVDNDQCGTYF